MIIPQAYILYRCRLYTYPSIPSTDTDPMYSSVTTSTREPLSEGGRSSRAGYSRVLRASLRALLCPSILPLPRLTGPDLPYPVLLQVAAPPPDRANLISLVAAAACTLSPNVGPSIIDGPPSYHPWHWLCGEVGTMVGVVGGLGERVGGLFIQSSKCHQYYIGLCRTITSPPPVYYTGDCSAASSRVGRSYRGRTGPWLRAGILVRC